MPRAAGSLGMPLLPRSEKPRYLASVDAPPGVALDDLVFSMHRDDFAAYEQRLLEAGEWPPSVERLAKDARAINAKRQAT